MPHTRFVPHVSGGASFGHDTSQASTLVQSTVHVPVHVTSHEPALTQLTVDPSPTVAVHALALSHV